MTKLIKEVEERAEFFHKKIQDYALNINRNRVMLIVALKQFRDEELYVTKGYETMDQYVTSPEVGIEAETVKKYIRILEALLAKNVDPLAISGIPINKLQLMGGAANPTEYIPMATEMPISDFKKILEEKEYGKKSKDDEIEKHIKNKQVVCPHCGKSFEVKK